MSVIIPAYNEAKCITACLETLRSQTLGPSNYEIIVVDDGSSDATPLIAAKYGVTLLRQDHRGPAIARNYGARVAAGSILAFLDADMTFAPDFLEKLIRPIVETGAVGAFTRDEHVSNVDQPWARYVSISSGLPPDRRMPADFGDTCSVFRAIRREAFLQVGGYDDIGCGEDVTLSKKLGQLAIRADMAVCYHRNPATISEVFKAARWYGKSTTVPHTLRNYVRLLPPFLLWRALRAGYRQRSWSYTAFQLVRDVGTLTGFIAIDIFKANHTK